MKKNVLIISISIIILILCLAFFLYTLKPADLTEELGNVVEEPEDIIAGIEVKDEESKTKDIENASYKDSTLFKSDNSEVKISDYKDKPIMILFFNEESEESIEVLEKVEELYSNYQDKIQFLMINTSKEVNKELSNKYSLEIYYDFNEETMKNYNITTVPSMIYIDQFNEVFNAKEGFTTTDALEANLDILSDNF